MQWGLAVVWEDGSRTWFPYEKWIEDWSKTGFSVSDVDASLFQPTADFALAPEEVGRGWLEKPPKRRQRTFVANDVDVNMLAQECDPEPDGCGPLGMLAQECDPEGES